MARSPGARASLVLGGVLSAAALQRTWNALHYPVFMGFDAKGNWDYVAMLLQRWRLPAPDAGWSTAHPPLFYALAAALGSLETAPDATSVGRPTVLLSSALGLAAVALTVRLVWVQSGGNLRRSVLAALLLVCLPVHICVSAMLSEEMLTSALVTFVVVGLIAELGRPPTERSPRLRPALLGGVAGLALLTKLSAVMLVGAGTLTLLAEGGRESRPRALAASAAFAGAAALVGGWFYLRNLWLYGYLYPHGLSAHAVMFEMPPGQRGPLDYLSFPLATFSGAEATDPALLHSVWAGTYASLWFDPHRHFLPKHAPGLVLAARVILATALVPTAAFAIGVLRGARRAWRQRSGPDRLLVGLVVLMLGGYVAFTWANPWFVTVKASFLLGLATPFAVYASEVLEGWLAPGGLRGIGVGAILAVLFAASVATFTFEGFFHKTEAPGVEWRSVRP